MIRKLIAVMSLVLVQLLVIPAVSQEAADEKEKDMKPRVQKQEYRHVVALGVNMPFSGGSNELGPLFAYYWFGENFKDPNLYMQFTLTTTRIYFIAAYRTDRIFAGIKPLVEHSTYSAWQQYYRGYSDTRRVFRGSNLGAIPFFQYNFLRILSARAYVHTAYFLYRLPILAGNVHKYVNMPKRHWQLKPGIEVILADVDSKNLDRIKHGYTFKVEYQYARRIGYGTWYDYDRMIWREKYRDVWAPPLGETQGIWYKSSVKDTHRLYFAAGGYYNFKHNINLQADVYGGYFKGVDRNNAEQIGYLQADYAIMPGYFVSEFYHNLYVISRLQLGFPLGFWDARLQPGFNMLYMPTKNEVVGQGRGAVTNPWFVRGYPRRIYTSVSCQLSMLVGNFLPIFIDYAYGIDAQRAKSANKAYLRKFSRGSHEFQVLIVGAFEKNSEKK